MFKSDCLTFFVIFFLIAQYAQTYPLEKNVICSQGVKSERVLSDRETTYAHSMSQNLIQYAEQQRSQVLLVSRVGADQSDRKFFEVNTEKPLSHKYTHAGLMYKTDSQEWRFIHLLNECAGSTSRIVEQSILDFFTDDPYFYDVMVTIPSTHFQTDILKVIEDKQTGSLGLARSLHFDKYSKIANPIVSAANEKNGVSYQNSNMWVLNVLIAAKSKLQDRKEIESHYLAEGFRPSQVLLTSTEVMFGGTQANVAIQDHTQEEKISGRFNFASALSLHRFLKTIDEQVLVDGHEICLNEICNQPVKSLP